MKLRSNGRKPNFWSDLHNGKGCKDSPPPAEPVLGPIPKRKKNLRSLIPHLQRFLYKRASDNGNGEKRQETIPLISKSLVSLLKTQGMTKIWAPAPFLMGALTCDFTVKDYVKSAEHVQFRPIEKNFSCFDATNSLIETDGAYFLGVRFLKGQPVLRSAGT
ncbi:unnamed protein product [Didymodactylos carnosus]|uniref:Uncharacterized protein n=1 Tax=Didymodactylos carnosus TaxID=1234261 RepID=A0A8S2J7M6_9BILA|nr:unnamed protein product [Didymodactylos carnosus]CAF3785100.1 unnamed protein product [Didymodactylos carnosus]